MLLGAGLGALTGGGIGLYMDRQEAELRAQLRGSGVSVTRVGHNIVLNMPSNITFGVDQDAIKPEFFQVLSSVSLVLKKFNQTLVDVYGHTDSDGPAEVNLDLSQRRADSVKAYMVEQGIRGARLNATGYGETQLKVDPEESDEDRAANRRIEFRVN